MKKLKESDRRRLVKYLAAEAELNHRFMEVIEDFSIGSEEVNVYAQESAASEAGRKTWQMVVLKFYETYTLYSQKGVFDLNAVAEFLQGADIIDSISAKREVLLLIAPFFPHMQMEEKEESDASYMTLY